MKTNLLNWAGPALLSAGVLALTACCSTPPSGEGAAALTYREGVPGGVAVQTFQETATVTAIDPAERKVTLVTPAGKKDTIKCGPEVVNFDQIRVGDQVKATVTQELAVAMAHAGAPSDGAAAVVALAPVGAKPGAVMANTVQVTAKVTAIDLKKHAATLQFPDGSTKTFPVRKDVDLTQRQVGEEVSIRFTEAVAISVEKP